jgi:hypothetical protein
VASRASKQRRKRRRRPDGGPQQQQRQQPAAERADPPAPARRRPASRGRGGDEPPPAPWGSFPLVELWVLAGIVMLIFGLLVVSGDGSRVFIGAGLGLASLGGLELSIREHFAGYRSHTLVLAGVPALIVLAVLFFADPGAVPPIARLLIALAVFGLAVYLLTRAFSRRSGGYAFRLSGLWRR